MVLIKHPQVFIPLLAEPASEMPATDEILVVLFIKPMANLRVPSNKLVVVVQIAFVKTLLADLGIGLNFFLF